MAQEYTPNKNLDLYVDTDKPDLRNQYNGAMRKIDTLLKGVDDDFSKDQNDIAGLRTLVNGYDDRIKANESGIDQATTDAAAAMSASTQNATDIAGVKTDVASATSVATAAQNTANQTKDDLTDTNRKLADMYTKTESDTRFAPLSNSGWVRARCTLGDTGNQSNVTCDYNNRTKQLFLYGSMMAGTANPSFVTLPSGCTVNPDAEAPLSGYVFNNGQFAHSANFTLRNRHFNANNIGSDTGAVLIPSLFFWE